MFEIFLVSVLFSMLGLILGFASNSFQVQGNPLADALDAELPQTHRSGVVHGWPRISVAIMLGTLRFAQPMVFHPNRSRILYKEDNSRFERVFPHPHQYGSGQ